MRRGITLKSRLTRIALAYALALQALLGAWAGLAHAGASFDPSLSLCRTIGTGEAERSGDPATPGSHCAAMCLSGACAAGDPPVVVSVVAEFSAPRLPFIGDTYLVDVVSGAVQSRGLTARGPPSIG
jgi:hypothetical protein